ncbi:MAG: glycosyltransferase [Opitutae bacterium]|nr:glycosyltransferase [Opitutae bacterium]MBT7740922.1 glycosyltransferase [Opitutae bacterium]
MTRTPRIIVSHPTGNTFVRALINELYSQGQLEKFHTTIGVGKDANRFTRILASRRKYCIPDPRISRQWFPEACRLLPFGQGCQEQRRRRVDQSYESLDLKVAKALHRHPGFSLHAYEDGAAESFRIAKELGIRRSYEMPIAHWATVRRLLAEEAERLPDWEPTLESTREPESKLVRKETELYLADCITCPSEFVLRSIPKKVRAMKPCQVAPFGSPPSSKHLEKASERHSQGPLKLLFVGSMSQRKGLGDLFKAMNQLDTKAITLTVLGQLSMPMGFYRTRYANFEYIEPCSNTQVRRVMKKHDLLVLPSIVEGRALVQQEALSCGLPLLVTPNAGGEDLIEEGETGFLIPIRQPQTLAERIEWFCRHRQELSEMRKLCQEKARGNTWTNYAQQIINFCLRNKSGRPDT